MSTDHKATRRGRPCALVLRRDLIRQLEERVATLEALGRPSSDGRVVPLQQLELDTTTHEERAA